MAQANRIPTGFLDLVGAESGGKNPPAYGDFLRPIVDLTELYAGQTLGVIQRSPLTNVIGTESPASVLDEAWLLRSISIETVLPLTTSQESWKFFLRRFPRSSANSAAITVGAAIYSTGVMTVPQNNARVVRSFVLPSPILLISGVQIVAQLTSHDGGAARTAEIGYGVNIFQ